MPAEAPPASPVAAAAAVPPAPVISPVTSMPEPPTKLSVPASALDLETSFEKPAVKPAAEKPSVTEPAKPAAEKPAAEPAAKPAVEPAPKPVEQKVKIGDKEYTTKELEALVAEKNKPAPKAEPRPAPAPAPKAELTPEQIAAQKAERATQEQQWVDNFIKHEGINFPITEDEMETILSGGKDAVALMGAKLANVASRSALLARKSMYEDLEPMFEQFRNVVAPLLTNHESVERNANEQAFLVAYPEFQPHLQTVRDIAGALEKQFPDQVRALTREQFAAEVAAQTDLQLQTEFKRWNPTATTTWKEYAKAAAAAATPAVTAPAATPAAAPAPAAAPKVKPPAGNSPAAIAAAATPDFHKSVAKDLQD